MNEFISDSQQPFALVFDFSALLGGNSCILYTLDSASNYFYNSKIEAVIADSGFSHEMRRFVCFLQYFLIKHGT
jgi:hypothetical protein